MAFKIDKYIPSINEKILELFPKTEAIIIWGGSLRPDFSIKSGDIDLIIVADQDLKDIQKIQKKLNNLSEFFKDEFELDPSLTDRNNFEKLYLITSYSTRNAHGIDIFLIKNNSKVIYGDSEILKLVPQITIDEAIKDVAPYVRDVFISGISKEIEKTSDITEYVAKEKSKFVVIIRTLYTIENKVTGSKKEVLNYLGEKYIDLKSLAEFLMDLYTTGKTTKKVNKDQVTELLRLTNERIANFL